MTFKCECCGKTHEDFPMDIAFKNPISYFMIPKDEREERIKSNSGIIIIDNNNYIIRGVLCVPVIKTGRRFCWGVWATVSEKDYDEIYDTWDNDCSGTVYDGILDGDIKVFENTLNLPLEIHMSSVGQRPSFIVKDKTSSLAQAQEKGISLEQVYQIHHEYFD